MECLVTFLSFSCCSHLLYITNGFYTCSNLPVKLLLHAEMSVTSIALEEANSLSLTVYLFVSLVFGSNASCFRRRSPHPSVVMAGDPFGGVWKHSWPSASVLCELCLPPFLLFSSSKLPDRTPRAGQRAGDPRAGRWSRLFGVTHRAEAGRPASFLHRPIGSEQYDVDGHPPLLAGSGFDPKERSRELQGGSGKNGGGGKCTCLFHSFLARRSVARTRTCDRSETIYFSPID